MAAGSAERLGSASPSGRNPMSSGRLRNSRFMGASTTSSSVPMAKQAARQPASSITVCTQGNSSDRTHPGASKGDADRHSAPTHEPVGQEQRLARVAQTHAAAAYQHALRQIEVPGQLGERRQEQARRHQADAELHHRARADPVHHAAQHRAQDRRHHEAEGERPGGDTAIPAKLLQDRRKQQGKGCARVDADAHRHEHDGDDQPAVIEGETHERDWLFCASCWSP